MKNLFLAIPLFFVISTGAQTTGTPKVTAMITICDKDPQKVTVIISNPLNEKLTIEVYSTEYGNQLSKMTQVNDYRANLDFSTASDGDYTIEVSCSRGEKIRKVVRMETKETIVRTAQLK